MDFRVDQSKGMHFIYLLPYSSTQALVESTIFSTKLVDEQFYISTIDNYLAEYYEVNEYEITHLINSMNNLKFEELNICWYDLTYENDKEVIEDLIQNC